MRGDPSRLQQVFWNLLSNAIKFSPSGSEVTIETSQKGSDLCVEINDEGMGIDPAFLPHVFDRFRQQDGSITRAHGGLGLGLSIVRQLVMLHGGSVRAHSAGRGAGSTFVVTLPLASDAQSALVAFDPHAVPAADLHGLAVMVVEDEEDMRAVIRLALEGAGAYVRAAANADEALMLYPDIRPDVLISDIGLPDLDGYALLNRLRQLDQGTSSAPAIALTAYARPEEERQALAAGYQLHMSKPFEPAALIVAVSQAALHTRGTPRPLRESLTDSDTQGLVTYPTNGTKFVE